MNECLTSEQIKAKALRNFARGKFCEGEIETTNVILKVVTYIDDDNSMKWERSEKVG